MKQIFPLFFCLSLSFASISSSKEDLSKKQVTIAKSIKIEGNVLTLNPQSPWSVRIYDMRGRLLWERNGLNGKGILIDPLEHGRYLLNIETPIEKITLFYKAD